MCWATLRYRNLKGNKNFSPQKWREINKSHFLISEFIIQNDSFIFLKKIALGKTQTKIADE